MKVLLVTGTLAEETVEQYAKQATSIEASVFVINVAVAAFLTPKTISANLNKTPLQGFDAILVPGLVRGDTAEVSEAVGIPTFKGPRYAADLPTVLDSLGDATLSTTTPACDLLKETIRRQLCKIIV